MNLGEFLKSFVIDAWFKAVMYVGAVVLVASFFLEVKGITNEQLQLLAGGAFLVGLGEWKNHKVASWIKPPNVYTGGPLLMSATVRRPDFVGVILECAGALLLGLAIWKIAAS